MSTTIDIVMPYGVTVEGDGSWYPKIVGAHPKKATGSRLALVPGPCRVAFSWAGESAADLVLVNGDDVKRPARLAEKRGGVHVLRSSSLGRARAIKSKSTRNASVAKPEPSRSTHSTQSSSTPRRGGGVGDRCVHGFRRPLVGAQASLLGYWRARRDRRRQGSEGYRYGNLVTRRCAPNRDRLCRETVAIHLRKQFQALRRVGAAQKPNGAGGDGQTGIPAGVYVYGKPGGANAGWSDGVPAARRVACGAAGGLCK